MKKTNTRLLFILFIGMIVFSASCSSNTSNTNKKSDGGNANQLPVTSVTIYAEMGNPSSAIDCGNTNTQTNAGAPKRMLVQSTSKNNLSDSTPPPNGGSCDGMGLCSVGVTETEILSGNGIPITFSFDPNGSPLEIKLSFSKQALYDKKPNHVNSYFLSTNPNNATYTFGSDFTFLCSMFAPLQLPAGAKILAGTVGNIAYTGTNGDNIIITFKLTI